MYTNEFEAFKAVKRDPLELRNVAYQTFAVCRKAVTELPLAIIYVQSSRIRNVLIKFLVNEFSEKDKK